MRSWLAKPKLAFVSQEARWLAKPKLAEGEREVRLRALRYGVTAFVWLAKPKLTVCEARVSEGW